jgi:5-methylcytosine-specific restriction protein A
MPTIKLLKTKRDTVPTLRKGKFQEIYQDKRWKKLRAVKMRANPLCERCEIKNKVVPAVEVHHKIPFDWGRTSAEVDDLAFDYDNLQSVCDPCHDDAHEEMKKMRMKDLFEANPVTN